MAEHFSFTSHAHHSKHEAWNQNVYTNNAYLVDESASGDHTWSVRGPRTAVYRWDSLVYGTPVQQGEASTKFRKKFTYELN